MTCVECATKNSNDSRYCKTCGSQLPDFVPPEVEPTLEERLNLALERLHTKQYGEAMVIIEEALVAEPDNVSAFAVKAMILERAGRTEEAIAAYEKVVELNPDSVTDRLKLEGLKGGVIERPQEPKQRREVFIPAGLAAAILLLCGATVIVVASVVNYDRGHPNSPPVVVVQQPAVQPPQSDTKTTSDEPHSIKAEVRPNRELLAQATPNPDAGTVIKPLTVSATVGPHPSKAPPTPLPATKKSSSEPVVMPDVAEKGSATGDSKTAASKDSGPKPIYDIRVTNGAAHDSGTTTGITPAAEAQAYMRIGREFQMAANYSQAIAAYQRALPLTSDKAPVYQQIGTCYRHLGDYAKAAPFFERAIAAYEQQQAKGGDVSEATQGIRACKLNLAMVKPGSTQ